MEFLKNGVIVWNSGEKVKRSEELTFIVYRSSYIVKEVVRASDLSPPKPHDFRRACLIGLECS